MSRDTTYWINNVERAENGLYHLKSQIIETVSYPTEKALTLAKIEDHSFWFSHRNHCITSMINNFPPPKQQPIFDIGGGNGCVSMAIQQAGHSVLLVEPGLPGATTALHRGVSSVINSTFEQLDINHAIPAIGLFDVLEHIKGDTQFLKDMHTKLQQNGRLYISVPAYQWLWSSQDKAAGHFRRYTLKQLRTVVESAGFTVEYASYFFRFLPLPIWALRTLPSYFNKKSHHKDEAKHTHSVAKDHMTQRSLLKRLIRKAHQSEVKLIQQRKSIGFGGSCLLCARKR